ncbi:MAG: DNA recombination protein RmuC [Lentisphaerae bacterium]|nr:DNA recombination protein RmuC [Lentisphaerota bacterium]MBQ4329644.1 DNA recombination protein RmuC [Lentisphaeria bacterium]
MVWLIISLLAVIVILLLILLLRKSENGAAELCERGLSSARRDIEESFSRNRLEQQQSSSLQQEMMKSSFAEFMKFLQEFRDAVRQADENSAEKLTGALQSYGDRTDKKTGELIRTLEEKIRLFEETTAAQLNSSRQLLDEKLKSIRDENSAKLDEMKKTVDEKLQSSMEKHFNESFKLISQRLEEVHKGLGEMQTLATGVGDLKKVLTNVKTRGNIGEIQLSNILEQYLVADQYAANVATVPGSKDIVEFAVKLPGKDENTPLWLPVDSKFPVEDYQRLLETYEQFPRLSPEVKRAQEQFARTVKKSASDIRSKYIYPPQTTAFALMFVPSEGIYAEILRMPGLFEQLQNEFQISVVGPSNLVAFLNSLQMGFKTLAIEKRSNEVWQILGAVKTEFGKFGDQMDKTRRSLESVVNHMELIGTRSRALERRLRNVQELSGDEAAAVLEFTGDEQI